jgi:RNA polymerase sigma-B factor
LPARSLDIYDSPEHGAAARRGTSPHRERTACTATRPGGDHAALLFLRYERDGDMAARTELIERFLPLARMLARRHARRSDSLDDLEQVARLGLVKAIDRFDPSRGNDFASYAVPTITGELRRHFRDAGWALHLPRSMQERALAVTAAVERLSARLGRSPSPHQLADELGLSVEEVLEAMVASAGHAAVSLDAPAPSPDGERGTIADALGAPDDRLELVERRPAMRRALKQLQPRERTILYMRFAQDLTQRDIARQLGISQMHVSRLIRDALEQMRELLDDAR